MNLKAFGIQFIIAAFLLASLPEWASPSPDSLIRQGNSMYNEGLYNDAIAQYKKVLEQGYESPKLYYNLGNAWFKLNDMAAAILYYEKAKKLDPNNPDILHNLRIANSRIPDKIEEVPEIFLVRWWNTFYNMFSVNSWARIGIGLFILFVVLGGIYFTGRGREIRKFAFWTGLIVLALTIFSLGLAAQKYHYSKKVNEAIVFSPSVTVKSAPNKTSVDLFVVHEGTKVEITDEAGEWYEIEIANGSIGWLPQSAVENI